MIVLLVNILNERMHGITQYEILVDVSLFTKINYQTSNFETISS